MVERHPNLIEDTEGIRRSLRDSKRLAILGIKPEDHASQPAHYVPRALQRGGWEIVPVPVYYPDVREILGQPVYRQLTDIPGMIDMVVVFRRSEDIPPHVQDIIAKQPKYAWFQLGIRNENAATELAAAGIKVIQDRCTMVEARTL
ncbi:MAG TPA: CoA-binding protein [Longimicrobiales bacterium]|nr:CoA-binding protein [Longimicrobiales bacterium]